MREADRAECRAMGMTPKEALRSSLKGSMEALSAIGDDGPVAMFGVSAVSLLDGIGTPWFLGRPEVQRHWRDLLVTGPVVIDHWLKTFRVLENVVAVENVKAVRLLRAWGAELGDEPETHGGVAFLRFRFMRAAIQGEGAAA